MARPEWRFGIVFHTQLDALRRGSAGKLRREMEAEVDPRSDAAAGYAIAIDAYPRFDGRRPEL
jgi:hypothetical protein